MESERAKERETDRLANWRMARIMKQRETNNNPKTAISEQREYSASRDRFIQTSTIFKACLMKSI